MSASPVSAAFVKTICYDKASRDYRAELDGELIGWFKTYHAAEVELDRVAYDRLTDGDCATASELDAKQSERAEGDGGASDDDTPPDAEPVNWNSICTDCDGEGRFPSDGCGDSAGGWAETCEACHGTGRAGPPSDPPPDDAPGEDIDGVPYPYMRMPEGDVLDADGMRVTFPVCRGCTTSDYPPSALQSHFCTECVNAMLHGLPNRFRAAEEAAKLAHTRQSIAVESRITTCPNCEGIHHVQRCPEIKQALFAPEPPETWKDIALGRELCKMRWKHYAKFIALLRGAPPAHLVMYADSYVAFIRDYNHASDVTRRDVLTVWMRLIGADRLAA